MSAETKWTKGEWRNMEGFNCYVETAEGLPLAVTHPHAIASPVAEDGVDCPTLDECLANGVLMGASKKLYEALAAFVAHYPMGINPSLDAAYIAARTALASARGEG